MESAPSAFLFWRRIPDKRVQALANMRRLRCGEVGAVGFPAVTGAIVGHGRSVDDIEPVKSGPGEGGPDQLIN